MEHSITQLSSNLILSLICIYGLSSCGPEKVQNDSPPIIEEEVAASGPVAEWHKGYGTDQGEHVHELRQTSDGGYIAIGQVASPTDDGSNVLVIKIDGNGDFLWQKEFGSSGQYDTGICVNETNDGYVIGGGLVTDTQDRFPR